MYRCLFLFIALLFSGCSMMNDPTTDDANSLRQQHGDGVYKNYNDSLQQGKADVTEEHLIGLKEKRVYDLSEPGVPIRQPAETRTFWVAPRTGGEFVTHGGWITIVIREEGWVGAPLHGRYLPSPKLVGVQRSFQRINNKKSDTEAQ